MTNDDVEILFRTSGDVTEKRTNYGGVYGYAYDGGFERARGDCRLVKIETGHH